MTLRNERMRFIAFLSFFEHAIAKALFRVHFNVAGSSLTGEALALRNGRRHSLLRRHLAVEGPEPERPGQHGSRYWPCALRALALESPSARHHGN